MPPYYLFVVAGVCWLLSGWNLIDEEPVLGIACWLAGAAVTGFVAGWYAKGGR